MDKQQRIQAAIEAHLTKTTDSQNQLATKLDVSAATISQMRAGNWANISDKMWNKVAAFFDIREDWQLFQTPNFQRVTKLCSDAQKQHKMLAVAAFTGSGKTTALKEYAKKNPASYYVLCTTVMQRKEFVRAIQRSMGLEDAGSISAGITAICERLNEVNSPVLLLDDAGKLSDTCLQLIQLIYDQTEFRAGIVVAGTEYLKNYVEKMAGKDKKGFRELKRRIQFWQPLATPSKSVLAQFAQHHGVTDVEAIDYLARQVKDYGTLRNVLMNAKHVVEQQPDTAINAELLASLHLGTYSHAHA